MPAKPFDLIVFGATGFTGRQAVRALVHRAAAESTHTPLRWAVAGRNGERLRAVVAEQVPAGAAQPGVVIADADQPDTLHALAAQTSVLLNLAGPYALTGEAVVQACIAQGTHHLDLAGETFWVRQLIERHHRAAQRAKVKIITCCGYEALPFDLAVLWGAQQLQQRSGEACRELKLIVSFTGQYWIPHSVNEVSRLATASPAKRQPVQSRVIVKMKKNTELMTSAIALPRGENFV